MPDIHILDQNTINQIAAGEVIERPASVVKELMENAVDALATAITIEIKEGGIGFLRITDNGCGIDESDVKVAFLRHSTSKIKTAEDLASVSSLGFRGEALSSIAAVGQVELISKTKEALMGVRYIIEGGKEVSLEQIGVPEGTTFIVKNLFFNTPARRKFLKSPATEGGYIADIVERISLSHPEISIRFIVNGKDRLHTPGNGNLKDVIYAIYGREITSNMIEADSRCEFMRMKGYIGKPVISRGNRSYENYFINGRYIKSSLISRALEDAYKTFNMQHRYPFTALHFSIDSSLLDVNVHPTKMELRFRNQEEIYPFITDNIKRLLSERELIVDAGYDDHKTVAKQIKEEVKEQRKLVSYKPLPEPFEVARKTYDFVKKSEIPFVKENSIDFYKADSVEKCKAKEERIEEKTEKNTEERAVKKAEEKVVEKTVEKAEKNREEKVVEKAEENAYRKVSKNEQMTLFDDRLLSKEARVKHVIVGQIFETYWIIQYGEKMFIIDQHAAHEKVLYERMMAKYKERNTLSQHVNPPIILTLNMNEENVLKDYGDIFSKFGYEIEHFGGREYAVRAIPYDLYSISKTELLLEIIDGLSEESIRRSTPEIITEKIASMSCKAAVKGNNRMSVAEADKLIDELLTLDNPYNCPHGRPTIISMSKYELEKKFKRIV